MLHRVEPIPFTDPRSIGIPPIPLPVVEQPTPDTLAQLAALRNTLISLGAPEYSTLGVMKF